MAPFRKILTTTALCLAVGVLLTLGWAVVQLCTAQVHILCLNGKICPCELADIRPADDGSYHLYMPQAVGQVLYIVPNSCGDAHLTAEAYVLPWFGRKRTMVNSAGYATVKLHP